MIKYLLPFFLFCGCTVATVTTDDLDYSSLDIQKAIENVVTVGVEMEDGSDRIFNTKFFRIPINKKIEAVRKDDRIRGLARITILGDRRPYVVDVHADVEEKQERGEWTTIGHDQRLARQMADQIQDYLVKHRDKNLIDHFRAF